MTMTVTLIVMASALAVMLLANFMGRRPTEFGKVRLFPYLGVQFIALVVFIVVAAHLKTLISGK